MKRKITLSFLVVLVCTASVFAQKKALVVGAPTTPIARYLNADARDTLAVKKLQEQGFTVTFLNDNETNVALTVEGQAKFDEANVIVISSTVGGSKVATFVGNAMTAGKSVLTWETAMFDDIKIMSGSLNITPTLASATMNSAAGATFIGNLTTFTYSSAATIVALPTTKNRILAAGAVSLANAPAKATDMTPLDLTDAVADTTISVAQYLKLGELNHLGTAATASVVAWGMFTNDNLPAITTEGWELFLRTVCVLADKTYVQATGVKNVTSEVNANLWYANGNLNIVVSKNLTNSKIRVYNTEGKLITNTFISGSGLISVPIANLKNGMYMVVGEGFKGKFIKN